MSPFFLPTIFIASLLCLERGVVCQQQQLIEIYSGPDCTGTALITATGSGSHTTGISALQSYAVTGLWKIRSCINNNCQNVGATLIHRPSRICTNWGFQPNSRIEVTRFGDPLQNQKQISFYPGIDLEGQPRSFGVNSSDINNFSYRSYFSTGNYSWTINDGRGGCVQPDATIVTRGYGITVAGNVNTALLGSIKEGCLNWSGGSSRVMDSNILIQMCLSGIALLICRTSSTWL